MLVMSFVSFCVVLVLAVDKGKVPQMYVVLVMCGVVVVVLVGSCYWRENGWVVIDGSLEKMVGL